jgi:AcrR family transcriptional regulator
MSARVTAPARNASGRRTSERLLRAAERLFAEQGLDAVSLRQISVAAGMRMTHAVAYHFGDKAGLIRAIVEDRSLRIEERRRPLLDELERQGRVGDLRALAQAGIHPAVELIGETGYYFRFLAQLDRHPRELSQLLVSGAFRSTLRVLELQDDAACPQLSAAVLEHRRKHATHLVLAALADLEANARGVPDKLAVEDLIDCVVALYSTPPSRPTLEAAGAEPKEGSTRRCP